MVRTLKVSCILNKTHVVYNDLLSYKKLRNIYEQNASGRLASKCIPVSSPVGQIAERQTATKGLRRIVDSTPHPNPLESVAL